MADMSRKFGVREGGDEAGVDSWKRQRRDCARNDAEMSVGKDRRSGDEKGQRRRR